MASFGRLVLTSAGLQAQAMAQGGTALKFSKIKMGDGTVTGNIAALTDLKSAKVTLNITDGELKNSSYTVAAFFSNEDLTEGFYWKEIGLFIEDASGKDVLYAYANAGSNYDFIPATQDEAYAKWIRVAVAVGNATNISIADYDGIIYLDYLTFENYKAEAEEIRIRGGRAVTGNSYSGKSSDNGIDILYVEGKSVQDGTPTPDAPVEIQSFGDGTNIHGGTCQLFDASKLVTRTQGGATVTNNGDGSFTVSGSGTMTEDFKGTSTYTHEETVAMLKAGNIMFKTEQTTYPYMFVQIKNNNGTLFELGNSSSATVTREITQDILDDETTYMQIGFYGTPTGSQGGVINPGTIKPILYQDGEGEWCEFNHADTVINQPLRSLPNGVCDTYENGKIVRRVGEFVLDGNETYQKNTTDDNNYLYFLRENGLIGGNSGLSDKLPEKTSGTMGVSDGNELQHVGFSVSKGYQVIYLNVGYYLTENTAEAVKQWFADNPVTILYELAQPVIEEVTLPTIPSWYDWTNVWHDGVETDITWLVKNGVNITPEEIGAATQADHQIKTYTSLGQLGLSDADMVADDVCANIYKIVSAMPTYGEFAFRGTSSGSNFIASIRKRIVDDLGMSVGDGMILLVRLVKFGADASPGKIEVMFDSSASTIILGSRFDGLTGGVQVDKFIRIYTADGFLPLTGGTLSDSVTIKKGTYPTVYFEGVDHDSRGGIQLGTNNLYYFVRNSIASAENERVLSLRNSNSHAVADALQLTDTVNGKSNYYNLYGEHNKPTASDVGAVATPSKVTGSGAVTVTLANNKEYTYTGVTTLKMTGAAVECHGFVTFGSSAPTVTMTGFTKVGGDDITKAAKSEIWEFSCFNKYIIWKNWSA